MVLFSGGVHQRLFASGLLRRYLIYNDIPLHLSQRIIRFLQHGLLGVILFQVFCMTRLTRFHWPQGIDIYIHDSQGLMTRLKPGILYSKSHRCFKWIAFSLPKVFVFFEKQHGLKHHIPLFLFLYLFFWIPNQNSTTLCPPKKTFFFQNGRSFFGVPLLFGWSQLRSRGIAFATRRCRPEAICPSWTCCLNHCKAGGETRQVLAFLLFFLWQSSQVQGLGIFPRKLHQKNKFSQPRFSGGAVVVWQLIDPKKPQGF